MLSRHESAVSPVSKAVCHAPSTTRSALPHEPRGAISDRDIPGILTRLISTFRARVAEHDYLIRSLVAHVVPPMGSMLLEMVVLTGTVCVESHQPIQLCHRDFRDASSVALSSPSVPTTRFCTASRARSTVRKSQRASGQSLFGPWVTLQTLR